MPLSKSFKSGFVSGFTSMFTFLSGGKQPVDPPCIATTEDAREDTWEQVNNGLEDAWRQVGDDLNRAMQQEELNPAYQTTKKVQT